MWCSAASPSATPKFTGICSINLTFLIPHPSSLLSQEVDDSHRADVGLGGVGIEMGDGLDRVAGDGRGRLRAVFLVDVVDADLAQFVGRLAPVEAEGAEVAVDFTKRLVRDVERGESAVVLERLPDRIVDRPVHAPPARQRRLVRSVGEIVRSAKS